MKRFGYRSACAIAALAPVLVLALTATRKGVQAQAPRGKQLYDEHCAECHGETGRGDGPAAAMLKPRPRDFTSGKYKIRSTESGSVPTDSDLLQSVKQGLYGTSMPGWDHVLPDADITEVIAYIKSLSPQFRSQQPVTVAIVPGTPSSPESVSRGQRAYEKLQCGKCHGTDGRGTGAVTTTFQDDWNQPLRSSDLTEPWTFHGGATARDIFLRFRTGMAGTPMPSFKDAATDAEMFDLANYVVSLARKPVWAMNAQEVAGFYAQLDADAKQNPVKRGEYLVDTMGCALCHSAYDAKQRLIPGKRLAGGLLVRIEPFGDFSTGNLTSDKETGLGGWSDDEFKRVMTKGILRDGTRLLPFPMDWASFSTMKPDDLSAILAYLRTVPPVVNRVPKPKWAPFPMYMWGKFKMLILGQDPPMSFFTVNATATGGGR